MVNIMKRNILNIKPKAPLSRLVPLIRLVSTAQNSKGIAVIPSVKTAFSEKLRFSSSSSNVMMNNSFSLSRAIPM